jgi:S-DNA-T family DNA segregation ATPase FtsK/SpoIIIE
MGRNKKNNKSKDSNQPGRKLPDVKLNLAKETKRSITVVVFVVLGLLTALSLLGIAGTVGELINQMAAQLLGVLSYLIPVFLLLIATAIFRQGSNVETSNHGYARTYVGALLLIMSTAALIHLVYVSAGISAFELAGEGRGGGYAGAALSGPLYSLFRFWAAALLLIALFVIGVLVTFNVHIKWPKFGKVPEGQVLPNGLASSELKINTMGSGGFTSDRVLDKNKRLSEDVTVMVPQGKQDSVQMKINMPDQTPNLGLEVTIDKKDWKLPPFDLLDDNKTEVDSGNIEHNVAIIKKTLSDFGIEVEMGEVNVGPTVTQYTFAPAAGVKLSRIAELQNNLALALSAQAIRMELPIPGKALVGIEVPNKVKQTVRLREVMQTTDFVNHKSKLALSLGRDVAGRPVVVDLAKMPHMLIAGASGMGKTICINNLFISLLYRNTPQDIKFIVIDPKRVDLTPYNGIPHLLTSVITERDKAVNSLKWAVAEMERRYKLLEQAGKRNIGEYNEKNSLPMPFIVIIVDELADLMTSSDKSEVESAIVRIAQMARAVGIHLVVATQRPSVEVITGLIKANISARISFTTVSQVDSRTILDTTGAEKLLGNGDMLFVSAEMAKPRRIQGAYLEGKEVKKVVDFFKQQAGAVIYDEDIVEKPKRGLGLPGGDGGGSDEDDMYEEAKEVVMQAGKASASLLQRRLRVGYARAARLLDILENKQVIGPGDGAKPREVYGYVPQSEKAEYGISEDSNENY